MDKQARRDAANACLYPMYGVSVEAFLRMSGAPKPHQELLHDGLLSRYNENLHFTFVSHQWLACRFPDPDGLQLRVLRKALNSGFHVISSVRDELEHGFRGRRMPDAERRAVMTGFLWVDFFGVPQIREVGGHAFVDAFKAAVASIPCYVTLCNTFVALAPSLFHEDGSIVNFATYLARGWCRTELLFWKLTADAQDRPVVSLRGAGNMPLYETNSIYEGLSPYTAAFTAEEDRTIVCEIARGHLHGLVAEQLAVAGEAEVGSKRWKRSLMCALTKAADVEFLCGPCNNNSGSLQQSSRSVFPQRPHVTFEQCYDALDEVAARTHLGVSRVLLAACAGKEDLLLTALKRADAGDICLRTKVPSDASKLFGFTPLSVASSYGHVACINMLLEHRADVTTKETTLKMTPLAFASSSKRASVEAINALLQAGAGIDSCHLFLSAIQLAVCNDECTLKITRLLEARADVHSRGMLGAPLMFFTALNFFDPHATVEVLVRARAEVNATRGRPPLLDKVLMAKTYVHDLFFRPCCETTYKMPLHNGDSLTALHIATWSGNWKVCAALMANGASTEIKVRGRTARGIARVQGTEAIFQHLEEDGTVWI